MRELLVILCCFTYIHIINGQRVNIWNSTMESINEDDWDFYEGEIVSNENCPVHSSCYEYKFHQELYGYWSSVGYHSMQIQYTLQTENLQGSSRKCELWFITGEKTDDWDKWTMISSETSDDTPKINTLSLTPFGGDDEYIIGFEIYANPMMAGNARCRLNDIYITGIPITNQPTTSTPTTNGPTTSPITPDPTKAPTNPTAIPTTSTPTTGSPTSTPTTNQPTTSTPTSSPITPGDPTKAPTTSAPTTNIPTTSIPTTTSPTTSPTTTIPTTSIPTASNPTDIPTTAIPTTAIPTTSNPTAISTAGDPTKAPTTSNPTTSDPPTSYIATTSNIVTTEYITTAKVFSTVKALHINESNLIKDNMIYIIIIGVGLLLVLIIITICCILKIKLNKNKIATMDTLTRITSNESTTIQIVDMPSPSTGSISIPKENDVGNKDLDKKAVLVMVQHEIISNSEDLEKQQSAKSELNENKFQYDEMDDDDSNDALYVSAKMNDDDYIETKMDDDNIDALYVTPKVINTATTTTNTPNGEGEFQGNNNIQNEYEIIESLLRRCDNKEWEKYLYNFKKPKLNDKLLKMIENDNMQVWEELIPEIGIRYLFKKLWNEETNKGDV